MPEQPSHADLRSLAVRLNRLQETVDALAGRVTRLESTAESDLAERVTRLEQSIKDITSRLGPRGPARER